jgi:hypothetical protein
MPWDTASCGERMSISLPSIRMRPESRATFPARIFIRVDFPAPFSPIRACTSPARRSNWTLFSASVAAKRLVMASSWSSGWGWGVVVMVAYQSGCVGQAAGVERPHTGMVERYQPLYWLTLSRVTSSLGIRMVVSAGGLLSIMFWATSTALRTISAGFCVAVPMKGDPACLSSATAPGFRPRR